jgi:WD40 repeat protein
MTVRESSNHRLLIVVGLLLLSLTACDTLQSLMSASTEGLVAVFEGHTATVTGVVFSPDDTTLASASLDTTVRLWDIATDEELLTLRRHSNKVYAVAFSPDGTLVASASGDSWAPAPPLGFGEHETPYPYTPESEMPTLFSVILWDVTTGAEQKRWGIETPTYAVTFSPDGTMLAAGSAIGKIDGSVWLWNLPSGELKATLRERERETVWSVAFSPDAMMLASGNGAGITLWDVTTGEVRASLAGSPVRSVVFSPDGTLLASGTASGTVSLWDAATNQEQVIPTKHDGIVYALAFSPDGEILASAGQDGTVRLWNVATKDTTAMIRIPETWVTSVAFSPDGTLLAFGSSDALIRLWDVAQVTGQ